MAWILIGHWCHRDHERREQLKRDGEELHRGFIMNWAMNDPKELMKAASRQDRRLTTPASGEIAELPAVVAALENMAAARARRTSPE